MFLGSSRHHSWKYGNCRLNPCAPVNMEGISAHRKTWAVGRIWIHFRKAWLMYQESLLFDLMFLLALSLYFCLCGICILYITWVVVYQSIMFKENEIDSHIYFSWEAYKSNRLKDTSQKCGTFLPCWCTQIFKMVFRIVFHMKQLVLVSKWVQMSFKNQSLSVEFLFYSKLCMIWWDSLVSDTGMFRCLHQFHT